MKHIFEEYIRTKPRKKIEEIIESTVEKHQLFYKHNNVLLNSEIKKIKIYFMKNWKKSKCNKQYFVQHHSQWLEAEVHLEEDSQGNSSTFNKRSRLIKKLQRLQRKKQKKK